MQEIKAAILAELAAGLGQVPFQCLAMESPQNEMKKFKKWLNSSENWSVRGASVENGNGDWFNGIATYGNAVTVLMGGQEHRFRLLRIDRLGCRRVYAIPVAMLDKFSALPRLDLTASDVSLIRGMANELSQRRAVPEQFIVVPHPAKADLRKNRAQWSGKELDTRALLNLLEATPELRQIIVAAVAAHYRSFLDGAEVPDGVFNFVLPSKAQDTDLWFYSALQPFVFSNAAGKSNAGPIIVTMREAADLQRWRRCYERLAVIRTSTGALLWPLLEDLEESESASKAGRILSEVLPTVPIGLTNGFLHHPQATDILLPVKPPQLTGEQRDLLRAAMSRLLYRKHAEAALQEWERQRQLPTAYRVNGFTAWQEILLAHTLKILFAESEHQGAAEALIVDTQRQHEEQERMIEEKLRRGIELLTNTERYKTEIIDRPDSAKDWSAAIENGVLAFWYTPKAGDDAGKALLAFRSDTLKRLIRRAGCTPELYDAFLRRCDNLKILDSRGRTINLNGSGNAVTFYSEKF